MTMTAMRDLLAGEAVWCVAATVQLHDGEVEFFKKQSNGQLMISVVTNQHAVPMWATYKGGDIIGRGIWAIPGIGTEVFVGFDQGDFEGDAFIVAPFGSAPDALTANITLVIDDTVEIRSVGGSANKLPTLADFNALRTAFDGHTHIYSAGPTAGAVTAVPVPLSTPPTGTVVLKAE